MEQANKSELSVLDRFNNWMKESIMIKLGSIGFLILILLIPTSWIQDLMLERQQRAETVIAEVSDKWAESQTLTGPVLVIPSHYEEEVKHPNGEIEKRTIHENTFLLPESLHIDSKIDPQILYRGIFEAAVYQSQFKIESKFQLPSRSKLGLAKSTIDWNEAHLIIGISDLRGISDSPTIKAGDKVLQGEPSNRIGFATQRFSNKLNEYDGQRYESSDLVTNGIKAPLNWSSPDDFTDEINIQLNLKGSDNLSFLPTGKTTTVHASGPWSNPSFNGEFLPSNREVNEAGFTADWKILHYNRPLDQIWKTEYLTLPNVAFGLKLLIPVDQYQKSIRTSKYGVLIILLTFVSLFLVELIKKIRIHPFQYILVGVALIVYYTLLISLSEQIGYNAAYGVASILTVGLLSFYARSFLTGTSLVILFTSVISTVYLFVFIIILQQDYSLLIGSLGLFIITGLIMYFSRKVNWYKG